MKTCLPFTLLLLCFPIILHAQTRDSVRVSYSEEVVDTTKVKFREAFRYITRATVEERTLVKAGGSLPLPAWGGYIGLMGGVGLEAGVEHKLTPSFSVQALLMSRYYRNGHFQRNYSLEIPVSVRYYYSQARRIRRGLSANNFSNNYFGLQVENVVYGVRRIARPYGGGGFYKPEPTEFYTLRGTDMLSALTLQWGIQRRVGQRGYFDFSLSFPVLPILNRQRSPSMMPSWGVNFKFGLGW